MQPLQIISDVACTVCGCVCDDLTAHVSGRTVVEIENGCPLADPWFAALAASTPPVARLAGEPASLDTAIHHARNILSNSHAPLIFGLSRSSTPGQREAVLLAEQLGATVDTTASVCHGPSIMAIQQVGESTSSLGEVKNRSDVIIFWGANPVESHPRHFERYSADATGMFTPDGRQGRTVVVIDTRPTATSEQADIFLQIGKESDFELITALRQVVAGDKIHAPAAGLAVTQIEELAQLMMSCNYGAVFFGLGLARTGIGHANVEVLLRLVAEVNAHARFTARRLRLPGDVAGADSVLCWLTGYPFAVNFARGYPRYNPGEYTANEVLERGETDCCVLVGGESIGEFSPAARAHLDQIPVILLDYPHATPPFAPAVHIVTAVYGVHAAGTAYRMDEIPVPLRQIAESHYPTDHDVLRRIAPQEPHSGELHFEEAHSAESHSGEKRGETP